MSPLFFQHALERSMMRAILATSDGWRPHKGPPLGVSVRADPDSREIAPGDFVVTYQPIAFTSEPDALRAERHELVGALIAGSLIPKGLKAVAGESWEGDYQVTYYYGSSRLVEGETLHFFSLNVNWLVTDVRWTKTPLWSGHASVESRKPDVGAVLPVLVSELLGRFPKCSVAHSAA